MNLSALVIGALLLPATARATMIGNPAARPESGRFGVTAFINAEGHRVTEADCTPDLEAGTGCDAIWSPFSSGGRVNVDLVKGFGIWGEGTWMTENIKEASFTAKGYRGAAGFRADIRLQDSIHLALWGALDKGMANYETDTPASEQGIYQVNPGSGFDATGDWTRAQAALLLLITDDNDSTNVYFGPTAVPYMRLNAINETDDVSHRFDPSRRFGGVLGAGLRSDRLGLPWSNSNVRLGTGAEVTFVDGFTSSLYFGATF